MKHRYEVEILYLDANQVDTINDLVKHGFWGAEEARRKERPSSMTWKISGDKPLTKEIATQSRIKFTKQFVERGERVKSIKFKEIGATL